MNLNFSNSNKSTNIDEIKKFENKFQINLPKDYIEFLLQFNGGTPDKVYFVEDDADLVVNFFFSLSDSKFNIEEYYLDIVIEQKLLPKSVLPIGEDAFGNIICLSCRNVDYGVVYFWDHESENDLRYLSKSLSFLLDNLKEEL
jgi:hypothetical protein